MLPGNKLVFWENIKLVFAALGFKAYQTGVFSAVSDPVLFGA